MRGVSYPKTLIQQKGKNYMPSNNKNELFGDEGIRNKRGKCYLLIIKSVSSHQLVVIENIV